ncbi:MAG: hemolysin family protein [Vicinamibacterales bacterium]
MPEFLFLFALIALNGLFAMSEIAIVSSRRARLTQMAEAGSGGARHALALTASPTRFLSSVQVGITSIGILNGAIGEASIAGRIRPFFEAVPLLAPYAATLSLAVMVITLTYVSLIIGELVPKRLALTQPEAVASLIARPMALLASAVRPLVSLLSVSTDGVLRLFGVRQTPQPGVTADEVRVMLEQGAAEGVFAETEHTLVTNVLNLDDRPVKAIQTPRADVVFLDVHDDRAGHLRALRERPHSVLPVCDGGLDTVIGVVRASRVLDVMLDDRPVDLPALAEPALFVPETMTLMALLEQFQRTHIPVALVVDEFGGVEGIVSLMDVVAAIVGDLPGDPAEDPSAVQRADGSWLLDGALEIATVARTLDDEGLLSDAGPQQYHTLGGLAMLALGRVPRTGDRFEWSQHHFEIVDMDGHRVDRVLAARLDAAAPPPAST